jgi:hemoglobin-like flavoprotein
MTPEQLAVVRESYASLGPDATAMAADFYGRLFAADPSTRALFSDGPEVMAVKFTAELDAIVEAIASFDEFRLRVADLGARHAAYGVQTRHYGAVGEALVASLAAHLGDRWDDQLEAAWRRAYNLVAETMMSAQQRVSRQADAPAARDARNDDRVRPPHG